MRPLIHRHEGHATQIHRQLPSVLAVALQRHRVRGLRVGSAERTYDAGCKEQIGYGPAAHLGRALARYQDTTEQVGDEHPESNKVSQASSLMMQRFYFFMPSGRIQFSERTSVKSCAKEPNLPRTRCVSDAEMHALSFGALWRPSSDSVDQDAKRQ
jgi:hypothetical protein